jgi:hypothetical protein
MRSPPVASALLDTTHAISKARTADKLLKLRFRSRPGVLLHLEIQLQGDAAMSRRMAEYFGFRSRPCAGRSSTSSRRAFDPLPGDLEARLATVRPLEDLKRLIFTAARAADLAAFRRELDATSTSGG